ncbi:MAG: hypothetical protein GY716_22215 [bacterium]|nr:hypothetical protein [bacterium]
MAKQKSTEATLVEIDPETGIAIEALAPENGDSDPPAQTAEPTGAELNQLREILVGSQTRNIEQRLARMEQRFEMAVASLTEEANDRIETLEGSLKDQLTSLCDKLSAQREERSKLFQQLKSDLETATKKLETKDGEISDRVSKMQGELRADILRQVNSVNEELDQRSETLSQELAGTAVTLRNESVDRATLSELLTQVALGINQPPDMMPELTQADTEEALDSVLGSAES